MFIFCIPKVVCKVQSYGCMCLATGTESVHFAHSGSVIERDSNKSSNFMQLSTLGCSLELRQDDSVSLCGTQGHPTAELYIPTDNQLGRKCGQIRCSSSLNQLMHQSLQINRVLPGRRISRQSMAMCTNNQKSSEIPRLPMIKSRHRK